MHSTIDINDVNAQVAERLARSSRSDSLLAVCLGDAHLLRSDEDRPNVCDQFQTVDWPYERLRKVAEEIRSLSLKPDVMVLYGDMTDTGHPDEFKRVFELLDPLSIPMVLALGNHEHPGPEPDDGPFKQTMAALREHGMHTNGPSDAWCMKTEMGAYQFVVVDSLSKGSLPSNQLNFLRQALRSGKPTILVCHRPLVKVGNWIDPLRLVDESLVDLLSNADHVPIIVSGHAHKHALVQVNHCVHIVGLSTCCGIDDVAGYQLLHMAEGTVQWCAFRTMPGPTCCDYKGPVVQYPGNLKWVELGRQFGKN